MTYSKGVPRIMFFSFYNSCSGGEQFSGKLTFTTVTDDFIEGSVTGTVFFTDNRCSFTDSKELSATFKVAYPDAP